MWSRRSIGCFLYLCISSSFELLLFFLFLLNLKNQQKQRILFILSFVCFRYFSVDQMLIYATTATTTTKPKWLNKQKDLIFKLIIINWTGGSDENAQDRRDWIEERENQNVMNCDRRIGEDRVMCAILETNVGQQQNLCNKYKLEREMMEWMFFLFGFICLFRLWWWAIKVLDSQNFGARNFVFL